MHGPKPDRQFNPETGIPYHLGGSHIVSERYRKAQRRRARIERAVDVARVIWFIVGFGCVVGGWYVIGSALLKFLQAGGTCG